MRRLPAFVVVLVSALSVGCPLMESPEIPSPASDSPPQPLDQLVSETLRRNREGRILSSQSHGAWQILHGVLAYGDDFQIETGDGLRPAIDFMLEGNPVDGFAPDTGDELGDPSRLGLRMAMQPSTKIGQGHRDQWLAILAQCDLPLETEILTREHQFTLEDWVRQAEYDVPRNLELEFSWSLIAFTAYRDTEYSWTARDGQQYSVADLLASELDQSLPSSVCGGTHRLIGMAMALEQRRNEQRPVTGIWQEADQRLREAVASAKQNQNADGSYSVAYLHRSGMTRDLGESLGTTGHVLEFLSFAAPDDTLKEPWVERTVRRLCQLLDLCSDVDLECGVLYHALHGLQEYQDRLRQPDQR